MQERSIEDFINILMSNTILQYNIYNTIVTLRELKYKINLNL